MVAAHIIGNDAAVTIGGLNGNLDLNVMMPVIAHNLLESLELLGNAATVLAEKCVRGITANVQQCHAYAERTASLVTAVAPGVHLAEKLNYFSKHFRKLLSNGERSIFRQTRTV